MAASAFGRRNERTRQAHARIEVGVPASPRAVARLLAAGDTVPDELVDSLKESLGEEVLIDLTVMVGYYQLLATFCATLGIEVEDAVPEAAMPLKGT